MELAGRASDAQLSDGPASTRAPATCHLRKRRKGGVVRKALARLLRRPRCVLTRTVRAPWRVRGTRRALELTRGNFRHMRARAGGRKLTVHSKASIALNPGIPRLVPSGVRLGREDLVGGRPDRYSLQTGLDTVCKGRYRAVASGAAWSRLPRLALVCCTRSSRGSLLHSPHKRPFRQEESRPPPSRHRRIDFC